MGSISIRVGGAWRTAKTIHVKTAGAWRNAKEVYVKSGGVWRLVWTAFDPIPTDYPAIYLFGNDYFNASVGAQEQFTFTGINTPVTLRFNVMASCGASFGASASANFAGGIVSGSGTGGSASWSSPQSSTKTFTIVVNNNTTVQFYAGLSAFGGFNQNASGDFNGEFTIDNLTSGHNGVASGSFSLSCSNSGMIDPGGLG